VSEKRRLQFVNELVGELLSLGLGDDRNFQLEQRKLTSIVYSHHCTCLELSPGMDPRATVTHICASMITAVASVAAMQPFDFAATRLVNTLTVAEQQAHAESGACKQPAFAGPLDVIRKTVATEGLLGVYKGVTANYLRFGPYCVLTFVFVEKLREIETVALRSWLITRVDAGMGSAARA